MIDIKIPTVGESINEVTLVKWIKKDGDYVQRDEVIAELESEKATFEVNAEQAGILQTVGKEGDTLNIGDVVAQNLPLLLQHLQPLPSLHLFSKVHPHQLQLQLARA